jgi:hypothetical protein
MPTKSCIYTVIYYIIYNIVAYFVLSYIFKRKNEMSNNIFKTSEFAIINDAYLRERYLFSILASNVHCMLLFRWTNGSTVVK